MHELGKMGEVKVTEWIQSGQPAWMKSIPRSKATANGASPTGFSKEWWRWFIRPCSAAGYILRLIRHRHIYTIHPRIFCKPQTNREGKACYFN